MYCIVVLYCCTVLLYCIVVLYCCTVVVLLLEYGVFVAYIEACVPFAGVDSLICKH